MIISFAICFLVGSALWFYGKLSKVRGTYGFYYEEACITRQQINSFWEIKEGGIHEKIEDIVLYCTKKGVEYRNTDFNRSLEGEEIEAAGNMGMLAGDMLCEGGFVSPYDRKGCVISKELSYQLFGTTSGIGEELFLSEKEAENEVEKSYIVRGILDTRDILCIVQGDDKSMYPYIRVKAKDIPLSVVKQELASVLPMKTSWYSEGDFYVGMGRIFLCLPLWGILFRLLFLMRRKMEQKKNLRAYSVFQMTVPFVWIVGIAGLLLLSLRFSDDYIPTAWSDFEFFSTLFREKAEMVFLLLKREWQLPDIGIFFNLFGIIGCSVLWMHLQKTLEKSILRMRKRV